MKRDQRESRRGAATALHGAAQYILGEALGYCFSLKPLSTPQESD